MQISNVDHSTVVTVLSVIYLDKMNTMEQASRKFLMRIFIFILAKVGQSFEWQLLHVSKSRKLTKGLSFSSSGFLSHSMS